MEFLMGSKSLMIGLFKTPSVLHAQLERKVE
jgi:hypothetical protein